MSKRDFLWLIGFPVYLIIGTIRHESAHALVAWLQGAEVTKFVFLPGLVDGQLYFGYVRWIGGDTNWLTTAAPYFLDLLTFAVFIALCQFVCFKRHWLWLNLVILGILSPLVNSGYQYFKPGLFGRGDIGRLMEKLPPWQVHAYMITTVLLYLAGTVIVFTRSAHIEAKKAPRTRS